MRNPTMLPTLLLSLLTLAAAAPADDTLLAALDYGSFQGAYSARYNISYWQRIPYAAPPTGQNRFRAPQPPLPIDGVYDSSRTFDMCPQRTVNGSEDCLYLGLYSRPRAPSTPLRPVIITFHGGGFVQGAASFSPPPSAYPILNVSSADLLFVYPSYRVNAFGFLAGAQVAADPESDPNVGLRDQRAVLRWVKKNIRVFGGDPDNITVWGQSAGGGSVVAQVIATPAGEENPPFKNALASSPFWPKTYRHDGPENQEIYDTLANLTGCAGPDSLQCLKTVDVQTIRNASLIITDSHKWTTSSFTWGPVIDDDFLMTPLSEVKPESVHVSAGFSMFNTHEGEPFVPTTLTSVPSDDAPFHAWLSGYLPTLPACAIAAVEAMYPPNGNFSARESYSDAYTRAGLIFRDTVLACPAYWMAGLTGKGWLGEYTISPAKHASDVYWWNSINQAQVDDPLHYQGYAGAFASFFAKSDPNALKLTADSVPGVPPLETNERWIIDAAGFDTTPLAELEERCNFWRKVAKKIPI
ncbi:Para-nitrobenzyl esterase [Paramyrothecium foliicola]|nr:Para-nitrobenzyl esterase [Paramyrothecium foliicola]